MIQKKEKVLYLEVLRIFSVYWVIYNHTGTFGFTNYSELNPGITFYINVIFGCFCKIAVPIFLMISGTLMISKEENIANLYKKRVLRIICLIFATSAYNLIYQFSTNPDQSISIFIICNKLFSTTEYCTYYLWLYLAFLIALPIFRQICFNMELIKYMVIIHLVLSIIPPLMSIVFSLNDFVFLKYTGVFSYWFIYPLVGYYISKMKYFNFSKNIGIKVLFISIIGFVFQCFMCVYYYNHGIVTPVDYLSIFSAAGIFYFAKFANVHGVKVPEKIKRAIYIVSPTTLGTFIISAILLWKMYPLYVNLLTCMPNQIAVLLWVLISMMICQVITYILRLFSPIRWML